MKDSMRSKVTDRSLLRNNFSQVALGARIMHRRAAAQLSQEEFAKRIGLTRETVCRIEKGAGIHLRTFARICQVLAVDSEELLWGAKR